MLLAVFCYCAVRFVSDLVKNHIVGFSTRRLNFISDSQEPAQQHYIPDRTGCPGLQVLPTPLLRGVREEAGERQEEVLWGADLR